MRSCASVVRRPSCWLALLCSVGVNMEKPCTGGTQDCIYDTCGDSFPHTTMMNVIKWFEHKPDGRLSCRTFCCSSRFDRRQIATCTLFPSLPWFGLLLVVILEWDGMFKGFAFSALLGISLMIPPTPGAWDYFRRQGS